MFYVALFFLIYMCKLDRTQVWIANIILRDSETSQQTQGRKSHSTLLWRGEGRQEEASHAISQSHLIYYPMTLTLKPWYFKTISQNYFQIYFNLRTWIIFKST